MVKHYLLGLNVCAFFILGDEVYILSIASNAGDPKTFEHLNFVVKEIIERILDEWPNNITLTDTDPNGNEHHCTTPMAFKSLFSKNMIRLLNIRYSKKDGEKIKELNKLEEELKVCHNFLVKNQFKKIILSQREIQLSQHVFYKFHELGQQRDNPYLLKCLKDGREKHEELRLMHDTGRECRRQAVWVGLQRHVIILIFAISLCLNLVPMSSIPDAELVDLDKKCMVESPELILDGEKSGIFKEPIDYVMIGNSVHRICAPLVNNERMYSLIFWTKTGAEDNNPTSEKIVSYYFFTLYIVFNKFQFGGVIYNIEKLNESFSLHNSHTEAESNVSKAITL